MTLDELKTNYTEELTVIKGIIGIADTSQDTPIVLAIDKAYLAILSYTRWDTFDTKYISAVYSLAIAYYNNDNVRNNSALGKRLITQKSDGSKSRTFAKGTIDFDKYGLIDEVRSILPMPKLKVF